MGFFFFKILTRFYFVRLASLPEEAKKDLEDHHSRYWFCYLSSDFHIFSCWQLARWDFSLCWVPLPKQKNQCCHFHHIDCYTSTRKLILVQIWRCKHYTALFIFCNCSARFSNFYWFIKLCLIPDNVWYFSKNNGIQWIFAVFLADLYCSFSWRFFWRFMKLFLCFYLLLPKGITLDGVMEKRSLNLESLVSISIFNF